ncbi:hypothetical protein [Aeromonas jandaei]|uniref:hypothetical protein n=1 Tax=Aeromonas jandaei TaxID=650 RepID=UPI003BA3204C
MSSDVSSSSISSTFLLLLSPALGYLALAVSSGCVAGFPQRIREQTAAGAAAKWLHGQHYGINERILISQARGIITLAFLLSTFTFLDSSQVRLCKQE